MPDTGAPWNLRYPDVTDLVVDGPEQFEDLADDVAAGLTLANIALGPNVVQTVKTDKFTSTSATFVTVTGLTATITPSLSTSKVLVIAQISHGMANVNSYGNFKVTRAGTDIYRGAASGSQVQAVFGGSITLDAGISGLSGSIVFLDSPATTSAVEYRVEARIGAGGNVFVNRSAANTDDANNMAGASSITVIEVAP